MSGGPRAPAAGGGQGAGDVKAVRAQLELMEQDCARVSAPDWTTPFADLEDAVDRLLPYHMFGAEDPAATDAREVDGAASPSRLAVSRHEAWQDYAMHRANELGMGLGMLDRQIRKAEQEALGRSQLPLLMLQSYATAEAQALVVSEQQRKANAERAAAEARQREAQEALQRQQAQQQAALLAQQQAQQQMQQQMLMRQQQQQQQQQQLQQQQMAAAAAASQQQQQAQMAQQPLGGVAAGVPQPVQAQQQAAQPPPGMQPPGMQPQPRPAAPAAPPQPAAKPLSAADLKAQQLAALKARIGARK